MSITSCNSVGYARIEIMKGKYKKLYRSTTDRIFFGVLGGFGEYFDIDPVILRVFYMGFSVFTALAPGILVYILMAFIVPIRPLVIHEKVEVKDTAQ